MRASNRTIAIAAVFITAAVTAFKFFFAIQLPLHPDEAYYWDWSRHLDWSYYDQGPGVAFYIRIFTSVLGNTIPALKLAALSAGLIAHILLFFAARRAGVSAASSLLFVCCTILVPGFFSGSFLIMHDSVLILFWCAAFLFMLRWIETDSSADLFALFACMALGFLGKHTMVFFGLSFVIWFVLTPASWRELRNMRLYAAIGFAAILSSPFIIWNMQNNWDGLGAILNLRSSGGAFANKSSTGAFVVGQALLLSPVWFALFLGFAFWILFLQLRNREIPRSLRSAMEMFHTDRSPEAAKNRFIWIIALILPVFFLALSRRREVQPNWTFASYAGIMLIFFVYRLEQKKWTRVILAAGAVVALAMNTFFLFSAPLTKALGIPQNPRTARILPHLRLAGSKEVIEAVDRQRQKIDPSAGILANRYQDAALAGFYLAGQPQVVSMNVMQRNQYSYWPGPEPGKNYLVFMVQDNTCEKATFFFQPVLYYMFEKIEEYPESEIVLDGVAVKRYQTWYVQNYKRDWKGLLLYYMVDAAILDFMPNMRGYNPGLNSAEGMASIQNYMNQNYFMRKGDVSCD
jgi:uncharacterized membrane protein